MSALSLVDAAAPGRVLVIGALPPEGRDLDVLAPASAVFEIEEALRANGFVARRSTWARFAPDELVDLRTLADESMLDRAVVLPGCVNVCRPDAADGLRLLAMAYVKDRRLTESRRARADVPLDVWAEARARGDEPALALLAEALRTGADTAPVARRVAGRARRVREAGVVTLSGLDGSGKSTQAERLRASLVAAGIDAVVEWNRLSHDRWLDAVARPVKKLLRRPAAPASASGGSSGAAPAALRGGLWVVVVALANALAHVRSVRTHTLAGRVVICDRYVLDSVVHLRSQYPAGLGQRLAVWLVRRLSPAPRAAFYLDVPAEVAYDRKPRPNALERLGRQAAAYREASDALGVTRLDGTLPADDLARLIAAEAWRRL